MSFGRRSSIWARLSTSSRYSFALSMIVSWIFVSFCFASWFVFDWSPLFLLIGPTGGWVFGRLDSFFSNIFDYGSIWKRLFRFVLLGIECNFFGGFSWCFADSFFYDVNKDKCRDMITELHSILPNLPNFNINKIQQSILSSMQNNYNIIFINADKNQGLVAMDRKYYILHAPTTLP